MLTKLGICTAGLRYMKKVGYIIQPTKKVKREKRELSLLLPIMKSKQIVYSIKVINIRINIVYSVIVYTLPNLLRQIAGKNYIDY